MDETVVPIATDPPGTRVSYGQNAEDVRLWRAFDGIERGFYVEVGGWDPEVDSISRSFYGRGWRGIVLEPVEELAARYRAARPRDEVITAMAGDRAGTSSFHAFLQSGLSTSVPAYWERHEAEGELGEERSVAVVTLDDVLSSQGADDIEFMVIDVEGAEAAVLRGLDLHRFRPKVLIVEATRPRSHSLSHEEWEPGVLSAGYQLAAFDGINRFYVVAEAEHLVAFLKDPPNALDGFEWRHADVLAREVERLTTGLQESLAQAEALKVERGALLAHIEALTGDRDGWARCSQLLEVERDALATEVGAWMGRAQAAEQQREAAQEQLAAVLASRSWRVTAPLRKLTSR